MGVGTALARIASSVSAVVQRAAEGSPRSGPWRLPITGGWLSPNVGDKINWWQHGYNPSGYSPSAIVQRCISLYAGTIASLPGTHWRRTERGGRARAENSAASRVLRKPNGYQTPSAFKLNLITSLFSEGNAYALALRNDRFEIDELHPFDPRLSAPVVAEDGSIFYRLGGNPMVEAALGDHQIIVPERDVLHVALSPDRRYPWPLVGATPLLAAAQDLALSAAFSDQQLKFLQNQARPSAVLATDMVLDRDQAQQVRDSWNEQSKGMHQGGVPILTAGLKVQPWNVPARDAQLAELMRMSAENIAHAFGVPLQLLALGSAPLGSTVALINLWYRSGLGFAINHVEESLDKLFGLRGEPEEYIEFDVGALLRAEEKDRIEMLTRATQGGIMSPNEARADLGYDAVEFGAEPRVQQQVVPLSAAAAIPGAPAAPAAPAAAAPVRSRAERRAALADMVERNLGDR